MYMQCTQAIYTGSTRPSQTRALLQLQAIAIQGVKKHSQDSLVPSLRTLVSWPFCQGQPVLAKPEHHMRLESLSSHFPAVRNAV